MSGGPRHGIQRLGYVPDVVTNPGAWTLAVAPLSAAEAQRISQPSTDSGLQPPAPNLCVVNLVQAHRDTIRNLFLPLPPYYPDEVIARRWASQYGYNIAPSVVCSAQKSAIALGSGTSSGEAENAVPVSAEWRIDSPSPGAHVSGIVPIMGTANFNPAEVQYYKLEIGPGSAPTTWTTFGTTHSSNVVGGVLETLQADALPEGEYVIRLIVVRNDGNYPTPYAVPITIDH